MSAEEKTQSRASAARVRFDIRSALKIIQLDQVTEDASENLLAAGITERAIGRWHLYYLACILGLLFGFQSSRRDDSRHKLRKKRLKQTPRFAQIPFARPHELVVHE